MGRKEREEKDRTLRLIYVHFLSAFDSVSSRWNITVQLENTEQLPTSFQRISEFYYSKIKSCDV